MPTKHMAFLKCYPVVGSMVLFGCGVAHDKYISSTSDANQAHSAVPARTPEPAVESKHSEDDDTLSDELKKAGFETWAGNKPRDHVTIEPDGVKLTKSEIAHILDDLGLEKGIRITYFSDDGPREFDVPAAAIPGLRFALSDGATKHTG